MSRDLLLLRPLKRFDGYSLFALRILSGSFLAWEMWFNISDAATMREVVGYFGDHGFAYPWFFGPLSAWAQFLIGIALILGLLTRWAGLLLAFNFAVGVAMVHWGHGFRDAWPAAVLVFIGLLFLTHGGGRFAVDSLLHRRWHRGALTISG